MSFFNSDKPTKLHHTLRPYHHGSLSLAMLTAASPPQLVPILRASTPESRHFPIVISTMSKTTNVNSFFPVATLTPVVPEVVHGASYTTLHVIQTEINSNAMYVLMRVATSDLGYLALTVAEAEFLVHSSSIPYVALTSSPEAPCAPCGGNFGPNHGDQSSVPPSSEDM